MDGSALESIYFQGFVCCLDVMEPCGADMLNEERIRLMTKMASYEEGKGKEYMPIKQYYRKDYVCLGMIKSFIVSSIAFGILFFCWVLYEMEYITELLAGKDLVELGTFILIIYAVFVAIYEVVALAVYNWRYTKATASIKEYHSVMRKVERLHEKEERSLPLED